jgi:membrane dipeptidase
VAVQPAAADQAARIFRVGRLTTQGKYIVGKMQDMGILVDVCGHNGEQTNLDILAMARRPVAITHGCCKALNDNPRNSSDRVIEAMARTGGLMGVAALDAFLTWEAKDAPVSIRDPILLERRSRATSMNSTI